MNEFETWKKINTLEAENKQLQAEVEKFTKQRDALLKACKKLANIAEVVGHCRGTWTVQHQRLAQQYAAEGRKAICQATPTDTPQDSPGKDV